MKTQRLLIVLTAVNLGLLCYQVIEPRLAVASTVDVPGVLRGRALEIVDARGRIRASIAVLPEDPKVIWKGKPYPETTLLRLMSPDGRPNVKLGLADGGWTCDRRGGQPDIHPGTGRRRGEHAEVDKQRQCGASDQALKREAG